jgi:hypothetical protein
VALLAERRQVAAAAEADAALAALRHANAVRGWAYGRGRVCVWPCACVHVRGAVCVCVYVCMWAARRVKAHRDMYEPGQRRDCGPVRANCSC